MHNRKNFHLIDITKLHTRTTGSKNEKGFTLIEVLISAVILLFIILSIFELYMVAIYSETSAKYRSLFASKGQEVLDMLLSQTIGGMAMTNSPMLADNSAVFNSIWPGCYSTAKYDREIRGLECYKKIDANHRWPQNQGGSTQPDLECNCFVIWKVETVTTAPVDFRIVTVYVLPAPGVNLTKAQVFMGIASRDDQWY